MQNKCILRELSMRIILLTIYLTLVSCGGSGGSNNPTDDTTIAEDDPNELQSQNQDPVANAGPDIDAILGERVVLDGSKSQDSDGQIIKFEWITEDVLLSENERFEKSDFSQGVHILTLTVTDDSGASDSDEVVVTVNANTPNQVPIADAGPDQTVIFNELVVLDGSLSHDNDGTLERFEWSNEGVLLSTEARFEKSDFAVGSHTLILKVTDNQGATATDSVVITVQAERLGLFANDFSSNSELRKIDPTLENVETIGNIGFQVTDIAFVQDKLYGITFDRFLEIDPKTAVGTSIGYMGVSNVNALASDENDIYAASTSGEFIKIDQNTGNAEIIGFYGSGLYSSGDLAFDENGDLYASVRTSSSTSDILAKIDLETGFADIIGEIGFDEVYGLAFQDETLYGVTFQGEIITIDRGNGTGSLKFQNSRFDFGGLTIH